MSLSNIWGLGEELVGALLEFVGGVGAGLDDEVGDEAIFLAVGAAPDDVAELLLEVHFVVEGLADEIVDHEHGGAVGRGVFGRVYSRQKAELLTSSW